MIDAFPADKSGPISPKVRVTNFEFLQSLLKATAALALSAMALIALFLFFAPSQFAAYIEKSEARKIASKTIPGSEFVPILGSVAVKGAALEVNKLQNTPDVERAIVSRRVQLNADDYPFLQYEIDPRHAETQIYFFWREATNPKITLYKSLYNSGKGKTTLNLSRIKDWKGAITEVGIDVYGELRSQPLRISSLSFTPFSRLDLLRAVWSEWNSIEGWTQKSINHLPVRPESAIVSQTAAAAAWSGGALLILLITYPLVRCCNGLSLVLVILIPWVGLDLMWQRQLSAQLIDTALIFSDKTQHQKMLTSIDGALYQYASHLKEEVLPEPGKRIFLLHDSKGHNFARLRLQHHLLPHNVYNYVKYPQKEHIQSGDYILVLGPIPKLDFDPERQVLSWWRTNHLKVQRVDHHKEGDLYLVVKLSQVGRASPDGSGTGQDKDNR